MDTEGEREGGTNWEIRINICTLWPRRQWHPTPVLLPGKSHAWRSLVGCSPWVARIRTQLSDFTFTFHFHALEKEMATHSSVLAWRIPGTGEPDGLPSVGSHRVGHDWSNLVAAAAVAESIYPFRLSQWLRWSSSICLQCRRLGFNPWVGKIFWRRKWQPTPVFLPGKSHEWRNLVGYNIWGHKESDTTEQLHTESILNLVFLMFRVFAVLTWISTSAKFSISIQATFLWTSRHLSIISHKDVKN